MNRTYLSLIVLVSVVFMGTAQNLNGFPWSYKQQSQWPGVCTIGQNQSPVNIDSADLTCAASNIPQTFQLNLFNNASISLAYGNWNFMGVPMSNFGFLTANDVNGGLQTFTADGISMHSFSEHSINGVFQRLELQIHFTSLNVSAINTAVVAVTFTATPNGNDNAANFMTLIDKLTKVPSNTVAFNMQDLIGSLAMDHQNVIHYLGSATTPPCQENVNWYVVEKPFMITQQELEFWDTTFGSKNSSLPATGNQRQQQPLNGRNFLKICNVQMQPNNNNICLDNDYAIAINKCWLLICGAMIFSMQIGFAFLEAGSVRKKNYGYVFYKLLLHSLIAVLSFWTVGYAFAFGNSYGAMLGGMIFYAGNAWNSCQPLLNEVSNYAHWQYQYAIAVVVVAITNGSISERTSLIATGIHCFLYTMIVYPVILAWTWGGGWLTVLGYQDFSGSGIVHCTGAFAGLAGMLLVGNRYNRYHKFQSIYDGETGVELALRGNKTTAIDRIPEEEGNMVHAVKDVGSIISVSNISRMRRKVDQNEYEYFEVTNLSYVMFGGLFLWVGFLFFNGGSTLGLIKMTMSYSNPLWQQAEVAVVNTFLAGSSAGIWCLIWKTPLMGGWHATRHMIEEAASVCNAFLAGMVANGAGMNNYDPWAAWVVGLIGSTFYMLLCKLLDKLELDDAVEAFQLHGGGGSAGVMCVAYFNKVNGIYYGNSTLGNVFGLQLLGWTVISAWSFTCSLVIYGILKYLKVLRLDLKSEIMGYDFVEFADEFDFSNRKLVPSTEHAKDHLRTHHHQ